MSARPGLAAIFSNSSAVGVAFSGGQGQRGGHLQLIDAGGTALQNLSFMTFVSKCIFSQGVLSGVLSSSTTSTVAKPPTLATYLYCAVPRDQTTLSYYPLPDAYGQELVSTEDNVYRVNASTGIVDSVFTDASQGFDVMAPGVFNGKFYFIDRYTKKLYAVTLP